MKINTILISAIIIAQSSFAQQTPTPYTTPLATNSTNVLTTANAAWYRGGNSNTSTAGNANIFGTLWNSPIYFSTNNTNRMALMGNAPAGSITGALGLGTITPLSYLHLSNFTPISGSNAGGRLFRTDGLAGIVNQWQFFTGTTTADATQKFRIFTTVQVPTALNGNFISDQNITLEASKKDMIFNAGGDIERMRILGVDHDLTAFAPYNAIAKAGNVGINQHQPLSKLHIGGYTGSSYGWRTWMDIGTLYGSDGGYDNMYIGLKKIATDVNEAIINWGNNPSSAPSQADRLRFIFTAHAGNGIASSQNGLQIAHMWANNAGDGRMAIGDFQTPGLDPQNTLEIRPSAGSPYWNSTAGQSGLRFSFLNSTKVPLPNPGSGVLSVDANGDVIYVQAGSSGGSGFVECSNTASAANLNADSKVNLNNNNLYFEKNDQINRNHIGMGYNCSSVLPGKLSVRQVHPAPISINSVGISGINQDTANVTTRIYAGVRGEASGLQIPALRITNIGGDFLAMGSSLNFGIRSKAQGNLGPYNFNYGLWSEADSSRSAIGVYGAGKNGSFESVGGAFYGVNGITNTFGIRAIADTWSSSLNKYGVWAEAPVQPNSVALYVAGDAICTGTASGFSDSTLKLNITNEQNAMTKLLRLRPVTYEMNISAYPSLNLASGTQHGFISQDVENTFPELVKNVTRPTEIDSLGNVISPAITKKALNYNGIISINTAAIQELNQKVENISLSDQSIKTNVVDLNNSLDKVLDMRGVSFDWTTTAQTNMNLETTGQIGFIAQEIQVVDPRLTFLGTDSLLHVKYEKIVPILAEAIQELNTELESKDSIINDLNSRLTTLENCLSGILPFLCQLNNSAIQANTPASQDAIRTQLSVKLNNASSIVLDQNVPNPFAEQTVINFSIPETVQKAQIHFYNSEGRIIQSVDVTDRGLGSLTVFGSDLSSGVYTYTLVADGISVATKKMVKQ